MFRLDADVQVYLHREPIDFRAGLNSLVTLVERSMQLDPFARAVFAFHNRARNRVKLLLYDRTGFWMLMKRLEEDRFAWPNRPQVVIETVSGLLPAEDLGDGRTWRLPTVPAAETGHVDRKSVV